jgi:hypothetical protein
MPTKLRKLKIHAVAVCRQGANYDDATGEGAHILLFKSQDGTQEMTMDAAAELLRKAKDMIDTGDAPDMPHALEVVSKAHPDLYHTYQQQSRQRARTAAISKADRFDTPRAAHPSQGHIPFHSTLVDADTRGTERPFRDGQTSPTGDKPTGALPPARSAGHMKFEELCAQQKARHPEWSDQQCMNEVMSSQAGTAAMAQHRRDHYTRAGSLDQVQGRL